MGKYDEYNYSGEQRRMKITVWFCPDCGKIHDHVPDYRGNCDYCDKYNLVEKTLISILEDMNQRFKRLEEK